MTGKTKGFTLVELLVVMAIIAFLTVGSFAGLTFGLRQARDTQRRTIVNSINTALLAYYADFQQYPNNTTNSGLGCSGTAITVGGFSYYRCTSAFNADSTSGLGLMYSSNQSGLKDYFEGTFNWGPIDKTAPNSYLGYYAGNVSSGTRALKYGICAQLENPNGGNVPKNDSTASDNGKKDCFCLGSDYDQYACRGLSPLQ